MNNAKILFYWCSLKILGKNVFFHYFRRKTPEFWKNTLFEHHHIGFFSKVLDFEVMLGKKKVCIPKTDVFYPKEKKKMFFSKSTKLKNEDGASDLVPKKGNKFWWQKFLADVVAGPKIGRVKVLTIFHQHKRFLIWIKNETVMTIYSKVPPPTDVSFFCSKTQWRPF